MEGANNEGDQSKGLIYEHNAAYVREARPDSCLLEEVLLLFRGTKAMVNIEVRMPEGESDYEKDEAF